MNNHQGIICKVPSLYTHTHLLSHWSNSSCCLSSASLYWEKASSTGRRSQVPAQVGYSLFCLSWGTQDTCSPLSSPGLKLVPCSLSLCGQKSQGNLFSLWKGAAIKEEEAYQKIQVWCHVPFIELCKKWQMVGIPKSLEIVLYSKLQCKNLSQFSTGEIKAPPNQSCFYSQGIISWKFSSLWGFTLNKAKAKFFFHGYLHSLPIPAFSFKSLHTHIGLLIHTRTPGSPLGLPWHGPKSSGFWSQHPFLMQRTIPHLWLCFQTV